LSQRVAREGAGADEGMVEVAVAVAGALAVRADITIN
jgi:hypothetical protein